MTVALFMQTNQPQTVIGKNFDLFNRPASRPTPRLFKAAQPQPQKQATASQRVLARQPVAASVASRCLERPVCQNELVLILA